jgi:hypothetical protein
MPAQRPALSGPIHVAWHAIVVASGWGIFGGFWWLVLLQKSHQLFTQIAWLLAGALILLPVVTLYWVMHNRGIYARKGPRRQVQVVETPYAQDWAGRPVRAQFGQLRLAQRITVDSIGEEKHFLAPDASQPLVYAS